MAAIIRPDSIRAFGHLKGIDFRSLLRHSLLPGWLHSLMALQFNRSEHNSNTIWRRSSEIRALTDQVSEIEPLPLIRSRKKILGD